MAKFDAAHSKCHSAIDDEYDIKIDSEEYLETERKRIDNFTRTLEDWIRSLESRSKEPEVRSSESVSSIGRASHAKTRSSIFRPIFRTPATPEVFFRLFVTITYYANIHT